MRRLVLVAAFVAAGASLINAQPVPAGARRELGTAIAQQPEATSLAGKPLMIPSTIPNQQKLEADLTQAQKTLASNPGDPEAMIWVGRRFGYLWRFNDAIAMFSRGIAMHPDNPKFYRHRGHRYISVRQFAAAQADFEKAVQLIKG
jgi:cytochrome c-type biogenesis protein CcmH/NrfG